MVRYSIMGTFLLYLVARFQRHLCFATLVEALYLRTPQVQIPDLGFQHHKP